MKVTDHIKNAKGKTLFSFEIVPPQKGESIQDLYNNVDPLMEFKPPFIDVTTSREEFVYIKKENGLLEQKIESNNYEICQQDESFIMLYELFPKFFEDGVFQLGDFGVGRQFQHLADIHEVFVDGGHAERRIDQRGPERAERHGDRRVQERL